MVLNGPLLVLRGYEQAFPQRTYKGPPSKHRTRDARQGRTMRVEVSTTRLPMSLHVVKGSKTTLVIVIGLQHLLLHGMESKTNNGEM